MKNTLVCTVGTSLKLNLERQQDEEWKQLLALRNIKGLALKLAEIPPDERMLGAEINSISSILNKRMLQERLSIHFLVSDTDDGRFLGKLLKEYFSLIRNPHRFEKVQYSVIEGLTDRSVTHFRTEGLRNLVREIAAIVRHAGSNTMLINATGGYKAQISLAGLIGQVLNIPVCYLFERFSEVITLPPQPVSLDMSFWLDHAALFHTLSQDRGEENPSAKDERFASLVDEIEADDERLIGLSPIGQLFHEGFRYRFREQKEYLLPPDAELPPEKKEIKYEDQNAEKHQGLANWLERIREVPYVKRIYTHYYHPGLPHPKTFRPSSKGDHTKVEGIYSDGKATTKFDVITTAASQNECNAVLADLLDRFC